MPDAEEGGESYPNEGDQTEPSDAGSGDSGDEGYEDGGGYDDSASGDYADGGDYGGSDYGDGSADYGGGKYDDILRPGGTPLCDPADQPGNRACPGGTAEAENLTNDLVARGNGYLYKPLPDGGAVYENPGDGFVTYRPVSSPPGYEPTVEPNLTGYDDINKIKFGNRPIGGGTK